MISSNDFVVEKIEDALEIYLFDNKIEHVKDIREYIKQVEVYDFNLGFLLKERFTGGKI